MYEDVDHHQSLVNMPALYLTDTPVRGWIFSGTSLR